MPNNYDLVVVGTGARGSPAAFKCVNAGWNVAVVDARPYGGTCALRGCDPKKVLVGGAQPVDWSRRMRGHGVTGDVSIRWSDLMAFKRTFTDPVPEQRRKSFEKAGIDTYHGRARFVDEDTLAVGEEHLRARHVLLANGAKPAPLPFEGADLLTTSTDFLELDELPDRLVFVGGGFISMEFAHIALRAGAQVTIIEFLKRPLGGFDPDLVDRLVDATRELGADIRLGTKVNRIERAKRGFRVFAESN